MIIENAISTNGFIIPNALFDHIIVRATFQMKQREIKLLAICLGAISNEMLKDGIDLAQLQPLCVIITKDGELNLKLQDDIMGQQVNLIVYPVEKWRNHSYNDYTMLICILEELCHYYYAITDEIVVKHKVITVIQNWIDKNVKIEELYDI